MMPRGRFTPEQRERQLAARRSPEVIAKHAAKIRGKKLSPEHKAK